MNLLIKTEDFLGYLFFEKVVCFLKIVTLFSLY